MADEERSSQHTVEGSSAARDTERIRSAVAQRESDRRLDAIFEGEYDESTDDEREQAAQDLIRVCSVAAAAVGLQPLPLLDIFFITPIQVAMARGIARIYGVGLDKKSALEIFRAVRQSLLAQHAAVTAAKFVPGYGWIVSASIANAATYAIGQLTDRYFRRGRSMLPVEMRRALKRFYRERFRRVFREKRDEATAMPQRPRT